MHRHRVRDGPDLVARRDLQVDPSTGVARASLGQRKARQVSWRALGSLLARFGWLTSQRQDSSRARGRKSDAAWPGERKSPQENPGASRSMQRRNRALTSTMTLQQNY